MVYFCATSWLLQNSVGDARCQGECANFSIATLCDLTHHPALKLHSLLAAPPLGLFLADRDASVPLPRALRVRWALLSSR